MELMYLKCIGVRCILMLTLNFKSIMRYIFFYCFAGGLYMTLELCYRQRTDWTMFYLAGIIGILLLCINEALSYDTDFILQVLICGTFAVMAEYVFGILFNYDYHIWDYRNLPFNYNGHIQLYFAILWYILSAIFIPVLDKIDYMMFPRKGIEKPYYVVFKHKI